MGAASPARWQTSHFSRMIGATSFVNVTGAFASAASDGAASVRMAQADTAPRFATRIARSPLKTHALLPHVEREVCLSHGNPTGPAGLWQWTTCNKLFRG